MSRFGVRRAVAFSAFAAAICSAAAAAPVSRPATNNRTEILFLGTAGGPPLRRERSEPATLLIVDGRLYLIDCGIGTAQRMIQANIDPLQVRTIFLTHLHSDHALGLADVMGDDFFELNLQRAAGSFDIYGPPQTSELVDAAFRFITVAARPFAVENPGAYPPMNDGRFASPFKVHEFSRDGSVYQDDKIRVTAAENSHYSLMSPQERSTFKSYAYRIETPHGTIVLTGDTGPSAAVERLAKGPDVLVAEADAVSPADRDRFIDMMAGRNHWSADRTRRFRAHFAAEHLDTGEIGQIASKAHVKAVILYHYDPSSKADQAAHVAGVKEHFDGRVFAPDDLDRYCLSASIVALCPPPAINTDRSGP